MRNTTRTDEEVVDQARKVLAAKSRTRWAMLLNAVVFLGMCGWCTLVGIRRIESLDGEQLTTGFVYGLAMAIVWTSFGLMGGLFLGKFLAGVGNDFRLQELTVLYHDRLRDLGQLPDSSNSKPTE